MTLQDIEDKKGVLRVDELLCCCRWVWVVRIEIDIQPKHSKGGHQRQGPLLEITLAIPFSDEYGHGSVIGLILL